MIPPPDPVLLVSPSGPSEIQKWTNEAIKFLKGFVAALELPAAPLRQEIVDGDEAQNRSIRLLHPLFEVGLRAGEPGVAVWLEYAAGRPERRERTGGLYGAVLADATSAGVSPSLLIRCRSLAGVEFPQFVEEKRARLSKSVAWAPDPPNNLGAVMAPPGPLSMRGHLALLTDRVQSMTDALDDPEKTLRDIGSMLRDRGMQPHLSQPTLAGGEIVGALEAHLSAAGILASGDTVSNTNSDGAKEAMQTQTLMDWVSQVLCRPPQARTRSDLDADVPPPR